MRRLSTVVVALAVFGLFAQHALAASPKLQKNPTPQCTWDDANPSVLTCTFKISGLGNVSQVGVSLDVAAGCANNPGHQPSGHVQSAAVTVPVTNGQATLVNQVFNIGLSCPPGLTAVIGNTAEVFVDGVSIGFVPIIQV